MDLERSNRPIDPATTPLESFDLKGLAAELMEGPTYQERGQVAITLVRDAHISVVLVVLGKGGQLHKHHAPTSATVTLVSGRMTFSSESAAKQIEMLPGTLVAFAATLDHALVADEPSVCLIVIGGRSE